MLDFEGTRAELHEYVVVPEFPGVERQGLQRRRQRGWSAAVAVALAVAVSAGGWMAVGSGHGGQPIQAAAFRLTKPMYVSGQVALDAKQSYALLSDGSDDATGIVPSFPKAIAHTADGGKTWDAWELPKSLSELTFTPMPTGSVEPSGGASSSGGPDPSGSVDPSGSPAPSVSTSVLNCTGDRCGGHRVAVFDKALLVLGPSSVKVLDWLSTDGGRTWRQVPTDVGAPVAAIPAGWPLVSVGGEVWTVDPAVGQYHPLSHQPAQRDTVPVVPGTLVRPAQDGSYWVVPSHIQGPTVVAVTRDRGRTWSKTELPGRLANVHVASADGRTGYVVALNQASGKPAGWRTTDGGQTWTGPYEVTGMRVPSGLVAFSGGSLLGLDLAPPVGSGAALTSPDGKSFSALPDAGIVGNPDDLGPALFGGYTVRTPGGVSNRLWYSADGKVFSLVPIPPNSQ